MDEFGGLLRADWSLAACLEKRSNGCATYTPLSSGGARSRRCGCCSARHTPLGAIEAHYQRKEYGLFPLLERNGANAPVKVMWAVQDDIRKLFRGCVVVMQLGDMGVLRIELSELLRQVEGMTFKEEQVLFPMCLELFSEDDWAFFAGEATERGGAAADGGAAEAAGPGAGVAHLQPAAS